MGRMRSVAVLFSLFCSHLKGDLYFSKKAETHYQIVVLDASIWFSDTSIRLRM